jgi:antitoxin HicB
MRHAVDAIEEAIAARIAQGEDVPEGHQRGPRLVRLPALTVLKVELYRQLRNIGITRAELARRLGWKRESVDRLFRLDHASRLEQLEAAFKALGQAVSVSIHAAA